MPLSNGPFRPSASMVALADLVIHQESLPETQNAFDMPSTGVEWLHLSPPAFASNYSCQKTAETLMSVCSLFSGFSSSSCLVHTRTSTYLTCSDHIDGFERQFTGINQQNGQVRIQSNNSNFTVAVGSPANKSSSDIVRYSCSL
jgi:hypothetical protein